MARRLPRSAPRRCPGRPVDPRPGTVLVGRPHRRPPHTRTVVATIAGAIVGVAATGPPLVPADRADPTLGDLYALYLNPDVWHRGIGTQLHAAALDRLRSCGFTHAGLWVLDTNERALRFYCRHGWTDTGRSQLDRGPGGTELHERRLHRDLSG
jgi:GNAT superfamily N-acetyltransferase